MALPEMSDFLLQTPHFQHAPMVLVPWNIPRMFHRYIASKWEMRGIFFAQVVTIERAVVLCTEDFSHPLIFSNASPITRNSILSFV